MWREWIYRFFASLIPAKMSQKSDQIQFHASSTGRLYIKEEEFFRTSRVKNLIAKLINSSIYKDIKEKNPAQAR